MSEVEVTPAAPPAIKRPQFGVNTREMSATVPLLEAGEYAAEIYSAGINVKVPLTLNLEKLFDDARKPYDGTDWVIECPFGFSLGFLLKSQKAIKVLGRDEPKFFSDRGIRLNFHKYGTVGKDSSGQDIDLSYTWMGSPVFKELLNVLELGDENYSELVGDVDWIDDLEFLLDRMGFSHDASKKFKESMPDEQLLVALNSLNYYRQFFELVAKDIEGKLCKVIIIQSKIPDYPAKMENKVYSGSFKNPSCGVVSYTQGAEEDL